MSRRQVHAADRDTAARDKESTSSKLSKTQSLVVNVNKSSKRKINELEKSLAEHELKAIKMDKSTMQVEKVLEKTSPIGRPGLPTYRVRKRYIRFTKTTSHNEFSQNTSPNKPSYSSVF